MGKEEELKILRGEQEGDTGGDFDGGINNFSGRPKGGEGNVFHGSMSGGSDSDSDMSDDLGGSGMSDDDDQIIDQDDDDDDLSDLVSGESASRSSLSDNDF